MSDALPGRPITGKITRIDPEADPTTRVFDVEVTVPNSDGRLRIGMVASLDVAHAAMAGSTAPMLPLAAIVRSPQDLQSLAVYAAENQNGRTIATLRKVQPWSDRRKRNHRFVRRTHRRASNYSRSDYGHRRFRGQRDPLMAHRTDSELIRSTRNTERFFVETRSISWVLLIGVIVWGILGYSRMPKRKDPEIPVREAVAVCAWPGVDAKKVEQLVTRKIEQKIAENSYIHPAGPGTNFGIRSVTLDGETMVYVQLAETVTDPEKQFDDIDVKLNSIVDLPQGAGPIQF